MDEEIKCERCHKKIKESLWFSRIDHKIICRKCNDKEQPKELMKQIADLEAKLAESEKEVKKLRRRNTDAYLKYYHSHKEQISKKRKELYRAKKELRIILGEDGELLL